MLFHVPTCAAGNFTPTQPSPIKGEGFEERHHARKNDTGRALRPKLSDPEAPVLGNAALLETIDCHERLLKGSAVRHRGQVASAPRPDRPPRQYRGSPSLLAARGL